MQKENGNESNDVAAAMLSVASVRKRSCQLTGISWAYF
jgi:hypothetical protein